VFFGLKIFSALWQNGFTHPLSLLFVREKQLKVSSVLFALRACSLALSTYTNVTQLHLRVWFLLFFG
jgi:hypothetical protein